MNIAIQEIDSISMAQAMLLPLLEGKAIALRVTDPRMMKKKRVHDPVLMIAPASLYGISGAKLVVSLQGFGCEIMEIGKLSPNLFFRVGLSAKASTLLIRELNQLYRTVKEPNNG
jgi:hypothetical protein